MDYGTENRHRRTLGVRGLAASGAVFIALAATPATAAQSASVTLRCTLNDGEAKDGLVQYYTVDSNQKTVAVAGDLYRIGADPNGHTGQAITSWSDTEITLINEEWIRNGWQRFRIVTVLDRLTGEIRSEDINNAYSGNCTVANLAKKMF